MFLVSSGLWHTQTAVQKTQNLLYALAYSEVVLSTRRCFKCIRTHQEYMKGLFRECSSVFEVSQSMLARALSFCNRFILFAECIRNYSKHTLRTKSIHYYTRRIPDFREVYLDCSAHSRQASGNYTRGRSGYTPSYFEYSGIH